MTALTYIYIDPGVSSTVLQTTTTASTALGANKCLIGTAQNNTVTASFIPYGPGQPLVDGANIGALSITAGNIAASTITAGKLNVTTLSAITADMGSLTTGTIGLDSGTSYIKSGATAYNSGTGFWLERNGGTPRFFIGNSAGNKLTWDGTTLSITGSLTATAGTIGGWSINSTSIYTGTEDHTGYTTNSGDITIYSNGTDASIHGFNFYIDTTGKFFNKSGDIGSWVVSSSTIEDSNARIIFNGGDPSIRVTGAGSEGYIGVGAATAPTTGNGIYLGTDGLGNGDYDFRAGDPAGVYMHWDDSAGTLKVEGGSVNVGTTGNLRGGQTAYNTGTGFFLGYESGAHKFSIGDATTNYLTWDGTTLVYTGATTALGFFGDASDGDVTISGNTTLSADKNYRSLTVNTGITLTTAGYKIYVAGTLTTSGTGSIVNNGGVGGNGTNGTSAPAGGTGGVAGTAGAGATMGAGKAGVAGQNGQTGSGNGNGGTAGLAANPAIGRSGGASGAGGDSNVGQTGGAAGASGAATSENVTVKTTAFSQSGNLTSGSEDVLTRKFSGVGATSGIDFTTGFGGAGGAGGAEGARSPDGGAATGGGGGGGGGGGIVFIAARKITNNGTISSNGGNGGNAGSPNSGANARAGGSGGGGGGGGGSVILIYESLTNSGSIVASAGSGGSGSAGNGGGASGSGGSSGTAGTVYKVKIQ